MDLPNVKELEKLLKMCRKQGIIELTMKDMSFKFGDLPLVAKGGQMVVEEEEEEEESKPTDEDMAYWSAQPDPLEGRQ